MSSVVELFDQLYVYAIVPPLTVRLIDPVFPPLHNTFVAVVVRASAAGCVTVTDEVALHPTLSVIVTV